MCIEESLYTRFGTTPLMLACGNGDFDLVKWLIDHGSDLFSTTKSGLTCIDWSVDHPHITDYLYKEQKKKLLITLINTKPPKSKIYDYNVYSIVKAYFY